MALVLGTPTAVPAQAQRGDSATVAATVARFHDALRAGDSTAALGLLADDAVILESGNTETRQEYRGHHLPGDIAFLRAVGSERGKLRVRVEGDAAWASSTSVMKGQYRGKALNITSAELMVLTRAPAGWRIRAIHWSSRPPGTGQVAWAAVTLDTTMAHRIMVTRCRQGNERPVPAEPGYPLHPAPATGRRWPASCDS